MIDVLVDENLPPSLCDVLAEKGITAKHIYDVDLAARSDSEVWAYARRSRAAVATKDADYLDFAALSDASKLVLFRVGNMRIKSLIQFARINLNRIDDFLKSDDQVLDLRP